MRRCRPASEAGPRASRPRGSRAGSPLHRGRRGHAPGRAAAPPSPRPPCRHARVVSEQKPVPAAQSRGCVWLTTAGEEMAHRPRTHPAERPPPPGGVADGGSSAAGDRERTSVSPLGTSGAGGGYRHEGALLGARRAGEGPSPVQAPSDPCTSRCSWCPRCLGCADGPGTPRPLPWELPGNLSD